ncbi:hypothetical protein OHAE_2866 [Ochrobactrum soli]|uniref:Uncharacterized protein n=1 Tax=Ochrobactrum soli TaxID=2448455 RepID=A0A2P9HFQ7_9HYPH|nr:hypothetical protein OHAE_2866 [[Ochrobactrum] soli]
MLFRGSQLHQHLYQCRKAPAAISQSLTPKGTPQRPSVAEKSQAAAQYH